MITLPDFSIEKSDDVSKDLVLKNLLEKCNEWIKSFLEENHDKGFTREFAAEKLSSAITSYRNSKTTKGSQICPFILYLKEEFETRSSYSILEKFHIEHFKEEKLPLIKKDHEEKFKNFPSNYPFAEHLELKDEELINLLLTIEILYEIQNGKYNDELGITLMTIKGNITDYSTNNQSKDDLFKGLDQSEIPTQGEHKTRAIVKDEMDISKSTLEKLIKEIKGFGINIPKGKLLSPKHQFLIKYYFNNKRV